MDKNYNYIPRKIEIKEPLDYLHFTSNNTIYGTQFHRFENIINNLKSEKLICDMSSDIFSKEIEINNFDLIYAGAQKNLGPAGCTLVIIKKDAIRMLPNTSRLILNANIKMLKNKKSLFFLLPQIA